MAVFASLPYEVLFRIMKLLDDMGYPRNANGSRSRRGLLKLSFCRTLREVALDISMRSVGFSLNRMDPESIIPDLEAMPHLKRRIRHIELCLDLDALADGGKPWDLSGLLRIFEKTPELSVSLELPVRQRGRAPAISFEEAMQRARLILPAPIASFSLEGDLRDSSDVFALHSLTADAKSLNYIFNRFLLENEDESLPDDIAWPQAEVLTLDAPLRSKEDYSRLFPELRQFYIYIRPGTPSLREGWASALPLKLQKLEMDCSEVDFGFDACVIRALSDLTALQSLKLELEAGVPEDGDDDSEDEDAVDFATTWRTAFVELLSKTSLQHLKIVDIREAEEDSLISREVVEGGLLDALKSVETLLALRTLHLGYPEKDNIDAFQQICDAKQITFSHTSF